MRVRRLVGWLDSLLDWIVRSFVWPCVRSFGKLVVCLLGLVVYAFCLFVDRSAGSNVRLLVRLFVCTLFAVGAGWFVCVGLVCLLIDWSDSSLVCGCVCLSVCFVV